MKKIIKKRIKFKWNNKKLTKKLKELYSILSLVNYNIKIIYNKKIS